MPKYHMTFFDPRATRPDSIDVLSSSMIGQGKRILEFGCATGYMAEYLQTQRGCTVLGVEYDAQAAAMAEQRGVRMIVGDAESEETATAIAEDVAKSGCFDVILASAVLEHLRDPQSILIRMRPFLAPDGYLVATLPNIAHWIMRRELLRGQFRYEPYGILDETHLRFFTIQTARELFWNSGYRVANIAYDPGEGIPILSAVARRIARLKRMEAALTLTWPGLLAYQMAILARPIAS